MRCDELSKNFLYAQKETKGSFDHVVLEAVNCPPADNAPIDN